MERAAYAEQMLMLEPALNLLLMAALLALRMPTNRRYFARVRCWGCR